MDICKLDRLTSTVLQMDLSIHAKCNMVHVKWSILYALVGFERVQTMKLTRSTVTVRADKSAWKF